MIFDDNSKIIFVKSKLSLYYHQISSNTHLISSPASCIFQIYPYDRLKISNFDLPKDVDRNMLEVSTALFLHT